MKQKQIIFPLLMLSLILFSGSSGFAQQSSKILVIMSPEISQDFSAVPGAGQVQIVNTYGKQEKVLFDQRCIPAENMLAEALTDKNFQVMTSGDLVSTKKISASDIIEATRGNLDKVKKTAVFNRANIIFNGVIDSEKGLGSNLDYYNSN